MANLNIRDGTRQGLKAWYETSMNGLGSDRILIWLSCEIKKWSTEYIMGEVIFYLYVKIESDE